MLMECARHLDADDPLKKAAGLIAERYDAIVALRNLCEHVGISNDWPESLHLADIVEKYIQNELEEAEYSERLEAMEGREREP